MRRKLCLGSCSLAGSRLYLLLLVVLEDNTITYVLNKLQTNKISYYFG